MAKQFASFEPSLPVGGTAEHPLAQVVRREPTTFTLGSSATINAQFWLGRFPLRPTAGWAVLAALLSVGLWRAPMQFEIRSIALLFILVDLLWGSIWRLAAGRTELLPLYAQATQESIWLPYIQAGSPAAQLLEWNYMTALPLLFRVGLPSVLLAGLLAAILDTMALGMTGLVLIITVLGWITRRALPLMLPFLHSLVTVLLPWLLALNIASYQQPVEKWYEQWSLPIILALLLTVHHWGEGCCLRLLNDRFGLGLMAVAELAILVLLIWVQAPLWLAPLVILWLATWLAVYHHQPLQRVSYAWLLSMLISALAVGQSL